MQSSLICIVPVGPSVDAMEIVEKKKLGTKTFETGRGHLLAPPHCKLEGDDLEAERSSELDEVNDGKVKLSCGPRLGADIASVVEVLRVDGKFKIVEIRLRGDRLRSLSSFIEVHRLGQGCEVSVGARGRRAWPNRPHVKHCGCDETEINASHIGGRWMLESSALVALISIVHYKVT